MRLGSVTAAVQRKLTLAIGKGGISKELVSTSGALWSSGVVQTLDAFSSGHVAGLGVIDVNVPRTLTSGAWIQWRHAKVSRGAGVTETTIMTWQTLAHRLSVSVHCAVGAGTNTTVLSTC